MQNLLNRFVRVKNEHSCLESCFKGRVYRVTTSDVVFVKWFDEGGYVMSTQISSNNLEVIK